ncbi:PREDICTED: small integral membrane protein 12-like [Galeopterus variegatus]|uniref:Small integral membrane protein 12 n=1 Tax=Galeopterus variegatus TaxID=482537 RepID=A0ABM0QCS7_GALVR|nr:PREDICTED: small integral membrane protein 12-like [Galeopterus variegatus]
MPFSGNGATSSSWQSVLCCWFMFPTLQDLLPSGSKEVQLCRGQEADAGETDRVHCWLKSLGFIWSGGLTQRAGWATGVTWPALWTVVRTYAPYVTFPVALMVRAVDYHLEWFIWENDPQPVEEEKSISEGRQEDRKLDELLGKDHARVVSLKDKLEFAPTAVLSRNHPEKN